MNRKSGKEASRRVTVSTPFNGSRYRFIRFARRGDDQRSARALVGESVELAGEICCAMLLHPAVRKALGHRSAWLDRASRDHAGCNELVARLDESCRRRERRSAAGKR